MSFNKIIICGYVGKDPELRYTATGTAVCDFSIASSEKRKSSSGEAQDLTTWFKVTFWGKHAEVAAEYITKGKQVYVEGRLSQREYTDRDGNKRISLEVNGTDMQFIGSKPESQGETATKAQAPMGNEEYRNRAMEKAGVNSSLDDSDLPF